MRVDSKDLYELMRRQIEAPQRVQRREGRYRGVSAPAVKIEGEEEGAEDGTPEVGLEVFRHAPAALRKMRHPHRKGMPLHTYRWLRYEELGALIARIQRGTREVSCTWEEAVPAFERIAKSLPRWKLIPPRMLVEWKRRKGQIIEKWQKGARVSFLMHLAQDYPVYQAALLLVAQEEGVSPHTIWESIKKARSWSRSRRLQNCLPPKNPAKPRPA
jgi:hypothetical protein